MKHGMLETLYFAKFPDGGIYCGNSFSAAAFETEAMAQEVADAISGKVVKRSAEYAIQWCNEVGVILVVTLANGRLVYSEHTPLSETRPATIKVEGDERERILEVRARQSG